jgi:hypothetical protein
LRKVTWIQQTPQKNVNPTETTPDPHHKTRDGAKDGGKGKIHPRPANCFALQHTKMGTQANISNEKAYMNPANTAKTLNPTEILPTEK